MRTVENCLKGRLISENRERQKDNCSLLRTMMKRARLSTFCNRITIRISFSSIYIIYILYALQLVYINTT